MPLLKKINMEDFHMKIKFFGLMLLAVVMVFALASCNGGGATTTTQAAGGNYTITFEGADVAAITVAENTAATAPAAPTKTGYTFAGWTYAGEAWDWENIVISDMTLTATWTPIEYTLTLNLDGGSVGNKTPNTYTIEGFTLPEAVKAGSKFDGWKNDATGAIATAIPAGTTGAQSFTAQWSAAADYSVDFDGAKQKLHYMEPNDSAVAIQYNQTYSTGAQKRSDGGMQVVYESEVSFNSSNPHILQFMKGLNNWHEIVTEGTNKYLKVTLDSTMTESKYTEVVKNEPYNVGLQFFTTSGVNATNNGEDNCFTIEFKYRQKNEGAFGINVYARNGDISRSNLLTIAPNGDILINADTIKPGERNNYMADDNTKIGNISFGEWHAFKIVMLEDEDGEGHYVSIYVDGNNLTATPLFLEDTCTWSLKYDQLMIFGGGTGAPAQVANIPGYYNEYDFDSVSVTGSYVAAE